ncbi:MAG: phosphate ABC transporter permease PstA [Allobaculum sp.]|uniref:phosphate ABC transporter permease PstA n=1 Tax=Allobaculum sp. TaxID=1872463 RepID=UPI00399B8B9B
MNIPLSSLSARSSGSSGSSIRSAHSVKRPVQATIKRLPASPSIQEYTAQSSSTLALPAGQFDIPRPSVPAKEQKKPLPLSEGKADVSGLILRALTWLYAGAGFLIMASMVIYILFTGVPNLSASLFAWTYTTDNVSMMPAIINTVLITVLTLAVSLPIGIGAAVYLEEYAPRESRFVSLVSVAAETLAGIPSIVFGLFGMLLFVTRMHLGLSLLSGVLTLAVLVLPLVLRTAQEALRAVPDSMREASYALGAGKLRTIFKVLLPQAAGGIFSGILLASGRIAGESAALIYTAGTLAKPAFDLMSPGATLSVHMYKLLNEGLYMPQASSVAVVLLVLCIIMNLGQMLICKKMTKGSIA